MPRHLHSPLMSAPENLALQSSDRAPTRTRTALQPIAKPFLSRPQYSARPRYPLLAQAAIAKPLAGCRTPALTSPTRAPAAGLKALALLPPPVAGST